MCKEPVKNCVIFSVSFLVVVLVLIASITLIAVGKNLIINAGNINDLPNFVPRTCIPSEAQVVYLKACIEYNSEYGPSTGDNWVAVWKDKTTGYSIVEDPFSGRFDQTRATNDLKDYSLNVKVPCMCYQIDGHGVPGNPTAYPIIQNYGYCQIWTTCFFNVELVLERQLNAADEASLGNKLLITGIVLLVSLAASLIGLCVYHIVANCKKEYTEF